MVSKVQAIRNVEDVDNNLLGTLRPADFQMLAPSIELVDLKAGHICCERGDEVTSAFFPCKSSLISFVIPFRSGGAVETVLIGREGACGGIVSQGRLPAYARAVVQFDGAFAKVDVRALDDVKAQSASMRNLFARYADCLLAQVFQSVACNAVHSIEQRTAKWLSAALDRTSSDVVPMAQEELAQMLGVGRSYLSRVLQSLKDREIIELSRRKIRVCDSGKLQSISCECNGLVRRHFDEVLSGIYPSDREGASERAA